MIENKKYNKRFFSKIENSSHEAAKVVLPVLQEFVHAKSVIDVGCGTGMWLKVWNEELKVEDYLGVEGPYLKKEIIKIPEKKVVFHDLKTPFNLNRKFDVAMSLEVAEHLPESVALQFITTLTSLSDVVLFSAAIPYQEGTYHINEQYPEYWAAHFKKLNYITIDCIRPKIWDELSVDFYYKQNILLFINQDAFSKFPALANYASHFDTNYLTRIHPVFWELKNKHIIKTKSFFGFLNWRWYRFKQKYLKKNEA